MNFGKAVVLQNPQNLLMPECFRRRSKTNLPWRPVH